MELIKLLIKESPSEAFLILAASVVAGISEGSIVLLIFTALDPEHRNLPYPILLPFAAGMLISASYIYHKHASLLAEKAMENMIVTICDGLRRSELRDIEKIGKSEAYGHLWNARLVTDGAIKILDMLHRCASIFTIWMYMWGISPFLALLLTISGLFYVLVYEAFQSVIRPAVSMENRVITELFSSFSHILYGFKEIRLNRRKKR